MLVTGGGMGSFFPGAGAFFGGSFYLGSLTSTFTDKLGFQLYAILRSPTLNNSNNTPSQVFVKDLSEFVSIIYPFYFYLNDTLIF